MTLAQLQSLLGWSALLHYAVLVAFFLAWVSARDRLYRLHSRWFQLDRARYDQAAYLMLGLYKLGIWLFLLVPWLVLRCIVAPVAGSAP